eukprot:COSAG04_NODE_21395_length_374_cov_0.934545_1_plen_61_part_10
MAVRMLCAATLAAGAAAAFPGTYKLDATWPADLAKIGVRHPTPPCRLLSAAGPSGLTPVRA